MAEPILIRCEGSGCPPCRGTDLCSMCGQCCSLVGEDEAVTIDHYRDDILARLDRGDFG